jgi:hypothetical protein
MTTPLRPITHRSSAYVKPIAQRGRAWKPDPITDQFRFVVRMAVACHEQSVPYEMAWSVEDRTMRATITATGTAGKIPVPKALPKPPKLKLVSSWKPAIWDAVYRTEAYYDPNLKRMRPGFVVEHSCGLSLVHPSDSGELGVTEHGDNDDIRQRWFVTHTASGKGFGLTLNFKRATDALVMAATFAVDWTEDVETLQHNPQFRLAGDTVIAAYGTSSYRESAKRRLSERERAA